MFYSIVTTLPLLFIEGKSFPLINLENVSLLISLLFLGCLGSGICYVAWNVATHKLGIVTTNNYIYIAPFVTMVAARLLLREAITVIGVLGALLIIAGVVVAGLKNTRNIESIG